VSELAVTTTKSLVEEAKTYVDSTWKGMYKVGGLAMLIAGILYLAGTTSGYYLGTPPGDNQGYWQSLAAQPALAQATYWIFALAGVLLIPAALGLYLALKGIDKNAMLVAAGLVCFFIVLDVGVTELNSLALVALAQNYTAATSDVQRATYAAAAEWGLATLPVATFFSWVGPSVGFLIISIVMQKGIFGKNTARLGMIANGLGIVAGFYFLVSVPVLALLLTPILIIYGVWLIATGRRLYKLGN